MYTSEKAHTLKIIFITSDMPFDIVILLTMYKRFYLES
jgi:hypothetical protein